jgi:photosystem II stability/assembly factor-like uncharacterized protein
MKRMRTLTASAAAALLCLITACQSSPGSNSGGSTQHSPSTAPIVVVAGVLVPPPGRVILPGDVTLSAPTGDVVWALLNSVYLYRSADRGSSWEQRPLPPAASAPNITEISFVDAAVGWILVAGVPETQCSGEGAALWHTMDAGATWQEVAYVDQSHQSAAGIGYAQCKGGLSFVDAMHGFLGASGENHQPTIYRTADAGLTWAATTLADPPGFTSMAGGFTLHAGAAARLGGTLLVSANGMQASGQGEYVFRSADGGITWVYAATAPLAQPTVTFVTASFWLELIYVGQSMETTDAGVSWHASASEYSQAAPIAPEIRFGDSSVGYATVRGQILRTVDGGLHWSDISTPGT